MRKYSKAAAVLLCAVFLAGCQKNGGEPTLVETGMTAVENREYSQALKSFEAAVSAKEDLIRAYRGEGMAHMGLGEYEQAVQSFDAALSETKEQQEETRKDILYYKAAALYRQQKYDDTIQVCGEILDIGQEGDAFCLMGTCYLEKGDEKAAQVNFDAAVAASPEDYDLYLDIYEAYKEQKLSATGDEYLQQALQIESKGKEDAYHKAKIYYYLENYEEAQAQLVELMGDKDGDAILLMGKIALALEDPVRSAGMYEQYIAEIGESPEAYNGIALAEIAQQDYDTALSAITKGLALEEEQGKQELYFNEIVAYEYKGDFLTAKAKAEAYVAEYPTDEAGQKEYQFLSGAAGASR